MPYVTSRYYPEVLIELHEALRNGGFRILLITTDDGEELDEKLIDPYLKDFFSVGNVVIEEKNKKHYLKIKTLKNIKKVKNLFLVNNYDDPYIIYEINKKNISSEFNLTLILLLLVILFILSGIINLFSLCGIINLSTIMKLKTQKKNHVKL